MRTQNQILLKNFDARFVDESRGRLISMPASSCPLNISWIDTKNKISRMYKKYGWKFVAGVFTYYLVRDVTLYVILPYMLLAQN